MKLKIRSFSIHIVTTFLFGTTMYLPVSAATQEPKENVHDPTSRARGEVEAREKLKRQGVSEEELRAIQKVFRPKPEDTAPHQVRNLRPLYPSKKDASAKVSLKGHDTVEKPKLSAAQPSLRGNSKRQPASQDQGHADQPARQKNESAREQTEKPETHHHHHHQLQQPPGECDSAGSPSEVANCKKAHEELKVKK